MNSGQIQVFLRPKKHCIMKKIRPLTKQTDMVAKEAAYFK